MSFHSTTALLSFVVCFTMGFNAYYRRTRALPNRLFGIFFFSLAAQSLVDFGYLSSRSFEQAVFWWNVDLVWPFVPTFLFLAIVATAGKEHLFKKAWFSLLVYLPVVVAVISEITMDAVTGPPEPFGDGWLCGPPKNAFIGAITIVWSIGIFGASAFQSIGLMRKAKTKSVKRQFLILAIGILISPIVLLSNLLYLMVYGNSAFVTTYLFLAFTVTIGYFVRLHGRFLLTPTSAVENVMATMFDGIFLLDEQFRIQFANRAAVELLDYKETPILGQPAQKFVPENSDLPKWIQSLNTSRETGLHKAKYIDTELLHANGETLPVSIGGSAIYDEESNLGGYLLVARDISEKRMLELELETYKLHLEELVTSRTRELKIEMANRIQTEKDNANLQAQLFQSQKMDAVGKLASGVAHDFNNLLHVIGGLTDLIMEELAQSDPFQEDLREIARATKTAAAITRQLLTFSRKQPVIPKVIELNEKLEQSLNMVEKFVGETVCVSFEPCELICNIRIDPAQLDQIIANLAVNARHAMPNGGTFTLSVGIEEILPGDQQKASGKRVGSYCSLTIQDTGVGMSTDVANRVFEPFFTTRKRDEGTGLGLSVVYGIVSQNKGYIDLESSVGRGTKFRILLPLIDEAVEGKRITSIRPINKGIETILLVEDHIQAKNLTTRMLTVKGYTVLAASSGEQAIALFERHGDAIDLLISDVVMPGIDGKTLSERLQNQKPELKIILISGHNDYAMDEPGQLKWTVPFLKKPFKPEQIHTLVREVLDN